MAHQAADELARLSPDSTGSRKIPRALAQAFLRTDCAPPMVKLIETGM